MGGKLVYQSDPRSRSKSLAIVLGVNIAGVDVFVSMPFLASEAQMDLAVAVE